jgi:transaldolase/glucose-6-phosphate isomerase
MEATQTQNNPLKQLAEYGQSPWLDYIRRDLFTTGELERLIEEDGLKGMTSNPAIFEKAIGSEHYKDSIAKLALEKGLSAVSLYEKLAIEDIQTAADALRGVYDATDKRDGYVSLEVSPALAHEGEGTLEEARRLWKAVDRPNLMVKVPATPMSVSMRFGSLYPKESTSTSRCFSRRRLIEKSPKRMSPDSKNARGNDGRN